MGILKTTREAMSIQQNRLRQPVMVVRGRSGPIYLTTAVPGVTATQNLPGPVRWSFLLFIGSIACDVWSSATLSGSLFFAIYCFYHRSRFLFGTKCFPVFPPVMGWFLVYVGIYLLHGLFLPNEYLGGFFTRLVTLLQAMIVLWIGSDILKDEKMAKKALLAYSIASVISALGFVFSLPGFVASGELGTTRASAIGTSATSLALATVMALGLWLNLAHKRLLPSVWMFVSMIVLSVAIVYSGTRNGFLAAIIGLSVYLVPYWKHRWRISTVIIGVIAIGGLAYIAAKSPVFYERWQAFVEEGDLASRDTIFEEALGMISERPLVGWQPVQFEYELGSRTGYSIKAAHNLYLHLFMEVGIVGAVPFLIGLALCVRRAWKARSLNLGLLPLAVLVATLASGMGGNTIYSKFLWFVIAVTVAVRVKPQGRSLLGRPIENRIQASSSELNSSTPGKVSSLGTQQRSF
jgi:O-antigen ligase